MSKLIKGDPTTQQYWDDRVKNIPDLKDMLFLDGRREEYWQRVRQVLLPWHNLRVLDVACGWGQFADIFDNYTGIDFSKKILEIASERNPDKFFIHSDVKKGDPPNEYDVIFEVNSLRSLGMTPDEFYKKFKPFAKKVVACLEADVFVIYQIYEK